MKQLARAISTRLRTLRESAGLSQAELAERADLSVAQVVKLEQGGKVHPRTSKILVLARALGIKPGAILDDLAFEEPETIEDKPEPVASSAEPTEPAVPATNSHHDVESSFDDSATDTEDQPKKKHKVKKDKKKRKKQKQS